MPAPDLNACLLLAALTIAMLYALTATLIAMHRGQIIRIQHHHLQQLRRPTLTDTQALDYELAELLRRGA